MTLPSSTLAALAWLHEPDAVIELRVEVPEGGSSPHWSGFAKGAVSGYFSTREALVRAAAVLDAGWPGRGGATVFPKSIWFSLNPCAPALLGRANNRLAAGPATGDKDIAQVVALYLDFDAKRPSGVSASDQEKAVAKLAARRALDWLRDELFWPEPMVCDSGNGYHLVFRVVAAGKPAEVSALVVRFLKACAAVFQVELRRSSRFMREYRKRELREYLDLIGEIIRQGQQEGFFRQDLPLGLVKRLIFGTLDELVSTWVLAGRRYELRTLAEPIMDLFLRGIGGEGDAADRRPVL